MTIDEAIDNNVELRGELVKEGRSRKATALQIGIEALKRCRTLAQESKLWALHPLPSETPRIEKKRSLHHIKQTLESNEVNQ